MDDAFRKYFTGDKIIWYIVAVLSLVSMLVIYSATGNLATRHHSGSAFYFLFRHAVFLLVGIGIIVVAHKISYKWFGRMAVVMLLIAIALLIIALISGTSLNEASRWITLPIVGLSFQPSEFAKIAIMIFLARQLAIYRDRVITSKIYFIQFFLPVLFVTGFIFTEDLSTAVLIGSASMILMFIGKVPVKYLASTIGVAGSLFALLLLLSLYIPDYLPHRVGTWRSRVESYITKDGGSTVNDKSVLVKENSQSYQVSKSELAIANGGFFGQGPGNSIQRYFLPHPYSDFVYAIIIEEFGMLGGIVVLLAYMILLFRAGVIVRASAMVFPALMVVGLTTTLVLQAIINMGVAVGIFPVTGQPLPLVSMGGTSVLFSCLAIGMILSVSRYNLEEKEKANESNN